MDALEKYITEIASDDWEGLEVIKAELNNTPNEAMGIYVDNQDYYLKKLGKSEIDSDTLKEVITRLVRQGRLEVRRHKPSSDALEGVELRGSASGVIDWNLDWFKISKKADK